MAIIKRLLLTAAIVGIAATAYFAGARTATTEPSLSPAPRTAVPAENTFDPTAVLLGEAKVPDSLLRSPATVEPTGLIVPTISK